MKIEDATSNLYQADPTFQRLGQADESNVLCIKARSEDEIAAVAKSRFKMLAIVFLVLIIPVWIWVPFSGDAGKLIWIPILITILAVIKFRCSYKLSVKATLMYKSLFIICDKNTQQLQFWCNSDIGSTVQHACTLWPSTNDNNNNNNNGAHSSIYGKKICDIGDRSTFKYASIQEFDQYVTRGQRGGHSYSQATFQGRFAYLHFYFENKQSPYRLENPPFTYNDANDIVDKINKKWGKNNGNFDQIISIIAIDAIASDNNDKNNNNNKNENYNQDIEGTYTTPN